MTEARLDADWNHTSAVLAMLANAHRDPKKHRAFTPDDFHPLRNRRRGGNGIPLTTKNIRLLKKAYIERKL